MEALCIANHFLCSCVCDMDHESAIKYNYIILLHEKKQNWQHWSHTLAEMSTEQESVLEVAGVTF